MVKFNIVLLILIKIIMQIFKTWMFKWWEVGLIKLCLLSLGIILGVYFQSILINFLWLWWTLFVVTAVYFIFKLLNNLKLSF